MTFLGDLRDGVARLAMFAELDCDVVGLAAGAGCLSDASVRDAFSAVAALSREVQKLEVVLAGVIAQRSARAAGHGGLAQGGGFRGPVQMIQEITGVSRGDAVRAVKVGEAVVAGFAGAGDDGAGGDGAGGGDGGSGEDSSPVRVVPWHQPLGDALLAGVVTRAQVDVIRRGLGEPPQVDGRADDEVREVWRVAASQLIDEAPSCTVEDLAASARAVRDALDPAGAEVRWTERYEARSFRMRTDADGTRRGYLVFDDATAAFWESVIAAALRPRRGGPRFMTDEERAAADELREDARTNDQLAYDLLTDLVQVGATANETDVFGARQAGVRVVTIAGAVGEADADGSLFGRLLRGGRGGADDTAQTGHTEDGATTLPGAMVERMVCNTGIVPLTVDACGNPLDLGREQRLFSPAQRLALAARDGGCVWPGCDRPPAMTEAHHIDEWVKDAGRTDIDRGVLLCAYHHVHLHVSGMRIVRDGKERFLLLPPPGDTDTPIELRSKSPLRWMFDPPPRTPWRAPRAAAPTR